MLFLLLTLMGNLTSAQIPFQYGRVYSDTLPAKFEKDVTTLRQHIYSSLPNYYKHGKYERMTYRFADQQAFYISGLITSGSVYSDWPEFESYVNEIVQKVMPPEMKNDTVIHAYLFRDGFYNAFMTGTGHTFINIGLFSYVHDEATLASILAHELAHYYMKHSLKGHVKRELGDFRSGMFRDNNRDQVFSRKNEYQADSLAMKWILASGYHISGLLNSFSSMRRLEEQQIRQMQNKWELKSTTHPLSDDRLKKLHEFYEKNRSNPGEYFLVGQNKFNRFKEEAKSEILKCLLKDFAYENCILRAFKFHLFDPDNPTYVYYIMEAIRRSCYMNNELWGKNFVTHRFYENTMIDGVRRKIEMKKHLFEGFDLGIMSIDPKQASKIKARFYWTGETRFKTNEEAYEFFGKVGEMLNCDECIFSNALSQTKDKNKRKALLKTYIGRPLATRKEFAKKLLNNTVIKGLANKKLLIFNEFQGYVKQGKEMIPIRLQGKNNGDDLKMIFDTIVQIFNDRIPLYMPSMRKYQINDYVMLQELEDFSWRRTISKGVKTELHILDPRYIELFYKYNVNEIEFINCRYGEYRKKEQSMEAYKEIMNATYQAVFDQTKRTRYLEVYMTALREIDNKLMKIRYYGGENELKFKEKGLNQIIDHIRVQILRKEKVATRLDDVVY